MAFLVYVLAALTAASLSVSASAPPKDYPKRQVDNCADSATSAWNVSYTVYCNTNQPGWDLFLPNDPTQINNTPGQDITDCINQCSTQWGPCRGVVFLTDSNTCYFKNSTFKYESDQASADNNSILAVPKASEVQGLPTACPYDDNSVQQSSMGQNFTIHCEQDIVGADLIPLGATQGVGYPYHTNSLADCMDICSQTTPNCQGVAWNPDLDQGFSNCYLKFNSGNPFQFISRTGSPPDSDAVIHTAVAHFPAINQAFTDNQVVNSTGGSSGGGTSYTLTLDQDMPGNDISQFHTTSLESCVTACAELTTARCVGAVFDTNYTSGWTNCRLKSAVGIPQQNDRGYIWAASLKAAATSSDASKSHASLAWVAGVVVGVLAALGLAVGGLVWFLLRRRRRQRQQDQQEAVAGAGASYHPIEQQQYHQHTDETWHADHKQSAYAHGWDAAHGGHQQQQQQAVELSPQAERNQVLPPAELSASMARPHELPGGWSPTKSAPARAPAELPGVSSPTGGGV